MHSASSRLRYTVTLLALLLFACFAKATPADILWQNMKTGDVVYWLMNGSALRASGSLATGVPTDWKIVGTPDFDLDGSPDILWQNMKTGDVVYWLMNGTKYVSSGLVYAGVPTDWKIVGTPDLDWDGYADILWQNTKTGDVVYWLMQGTTYAGAGSIYQGVSTDWKITGTPDLDQDGYADILWQNTRTGDVAYWLMSGTDYLGSGVIASGVPTDWNIAGTPSLDGGGQTTPLWLNFRTGDIVEWLMNGTNYLDSGPVYTGVPTDWKIVGTPNLAPIDLSVGKPAIPFRRNTLSGGIVHFPRDYKGKLVMLDFWASWCGPCRDEIPGLVSVYNKYHARGFEVLGISLDTDGQASALQSFLNNHNMPWPQVYDGKYWDAEIAVLYGINSIPMAYLIDGNTGKIVAEGDALRGGSLDGTISNALQQMGL